jgi:hypothetical protein
VLVTGSRAVIKDNTGEPSRFRKKVGEWLVDAKASRVAVPAPAPRPLSRPPSPSRSRHQSASTGTDDRAASPAASRSRSRGNGCWEPWHYEDPLAPYRK